MSTIRKLFETAAPLLEHGLDAVATHDPALGALIEAGLKDGSVLARLVLIWSPAPAVRLVLMGDVVGTRHFEYTEGGVSALAH